jgi:rod shape determining protein RodA
MGVLRVESVRAQGWVTHRTAPRWRDFDTQLAIYALALVVIGLAMAYTNSGDDPLTIGSTFLRGLMWAGVAIVVFTLAAVFDYRWLRTFAWPLYAINLGLLLLTLAVGDGVGGTQRWVALGPLQFQFSELSKILTIVVLANYLAAPERRLDSLRTILGACALIAPSGALVLMQPDLGTSLVFGAILVGTLFLSGVGLRWLGVLVGIAVAAIPIVWTYVLRDYQKQRLLSFLDPAADPQGAGFQLLQSQAAVQAGGLAGVGLTNGSAGSVELLPVQATDFVFAILAQELGFIGGLVVLGLFVALLWRVLAAAWRSRDPFGLAVGGGIASMVLFQVIVNVGMVLGIMPITGIPLPFVTHGGASLVSLALGLGLLQSINVHHGRSDW